MIKYVGKVERNNIVKNILCHMEDFDLSPHSITSKQLFNIKFVFVQWMVNLCKIEVVTIIRKRNEDVEWKN